MIRKIKLLMVCIPFILLLTSCSELFNGDPPLKQESDLGKMLEALAPDEDERYSRGNTVYFGKTDGIEPIEWIILSEADDRLLLMSKEPVAQMAYKAEATGDPDWEHSDLRKWLADEFYLAAFTAEERKQIEYNLICDNGRLLADKVFLLSGADLAAVTIRLSRYAIDASEEKWWQRDMTEAVTDRECAPSEVYGVRPAIWVNRDGVALTRSEGNDIQDRGTEGVKCVTVKGTFTEKYKAMSYCYLEGSRVRIFLEKGVSVPCSIVDDCDYAVELTESILSLKYPGAAGSYANSSDILSAQEASFGKGHFDGIAVNDDKYNIFIVKNDNSDAFVRCGADKKADFLSSKLYSIVRESFIISYGGYKFSMLALSEQVIQSNFYHQPDEAGMLQDGLKEYIRSRFLVLQDRFAFDSSDMSSVNRRDGAIKGVDVTPDNAEELCTTRFAQKSGGPKDDEITVYYRMFMYLFERPEGSKIDKLAAKYNEMSRRSEFTSETYASLLKSVYGDDFFEKFSDWYSSHYLY